MRRLRTKTGTGTTAEQRLRLHKLKLFYEAMLASGGLLDVASSLEAISAALDQDPDLYDFNTTDSAASAESWSPESRFEPRKDADDVVEASL